MNIGQWGFAIHVEASSQEGAQLRGVMRVVWRPRCRVGDDGSHLSISFKIPTPSSLVQLCLVCPLVRTQTFLTPNTSTSCDVTPRQTSRRHSCPNHPALLQHTPRRQFGASTGLSQTHTKLQGLNTESMLSNQSFNEL